LRPSYSPNEVPGHRIGDQARAQVPFLVEDTEDNRVMMRRLLEMSGFQVTEAVNGVEGQCQRQNLKTPEIILMDLSLPLVDGFGSNQADPPVASPRDCANHRWSQHTTRWIFTPMALAAGCDAYITNQSITVNSRTSLSALLDRIERKR
jgi:DNA-binding NarL/FixJ family response regulator